MPEPNYPSRLRRAGRILRRPSAVVAVVWLVLILTAVIAAPVLAPNGPYVQNLTHTYALPSLQYPLGTDGLGRSILARILYGGQISLEGVAIGTIVAMVIGVPLGMFAGYLGGWADRALSFISDLLMAVPFLLIVLVGYSIYPNNNVISMTIFGLFAAAPIFRIIRGSTVTITNELYVVAARGTGLTHWAVVTRHIAPRLTGVISVQASVVAAVALATQVGLGFLSLDVAPPAASWGGTIAEAARSLFASLWPMIPPTVVIVLTILAFGVLGDVGQESASSRSTVSLRKRKRSTPAAVVDAAPGALLTVRGLTVRVPQGDGGSLTLVENVDIDVGVGEVVGLVGESGAGKSVTARALLGINGNVTTSGSALFHDADLLSIDEKELGRIRGSKIGFIGQDPMSSLDPLFRVESQLIEAVRTHHGVSRKQARVRVTELLRDVRIADPEAVAKKYPFELSGGLAQRVSIALALAGDPELLIADEPTTALDVTVQMEVLGLLQRLRKERNLAIILVTHDWGVVADMCDRAITMYAGEVVEVGSVDDVFAAPRHPYTLALRRSDPHLQPVGATLVSIPGSVPPPGSWPGGCRFADRCRFATDECRSAHPDLYRIRSSRESRCIRIPVIAEEVNREPINA
jgi:oligopeptide/dipeptide ABC transporter ATP-binding protein